MPDASDAVVSALREQIAELEKRLGIAQEDLIDMAREAGALRSDLARLQAQLLVLTADRDAWRAQADRSWWRKLTGGRAPVLRADARGPPGVTGAVAHSDDPGIYVGISDLDRAANRNHAHHRSACLPAYAIAALVDRNFRICLARP